METSVCPNCGAPAGEGRFCARCGAPLAAGQAGEQAAAAATPPGPPTQGVTSPPPPPYTAPPPPPAATPPGPPTQAMPPSGGTPPAYGLTAPFPPSVPEKGGGAGKALLLGVLGLLVIAAAVVLLLGFAVGPKWFVGEKDGKAAETETSQGSGGKDAKGDKDSGKGGGKKGGIATDIIVPMPPGWQQGSEVLGGEMGDMLESEIGGMGNIEAFYADSGMSNMIIAMSMDNAGFYDLPPADATLSEMEEYIKENREELLDDFTSGLLSGGVTEADVGGIKAFQTKAGDVGVEIPINAGMGPMGLGADIMVFFKSDKTFVVMLMSLEGPVSPDTVKFLKNDITFK